MSRVSFSCGVKLSSVISLSPQTRHAAISAVEIQERITGIVGAGRQDFAEEDSVRPGCVGADHAAVEAGQAAGQEGRARDQGFGRQPDETVVLIGDAAGEAFGDGLLVLGQDGHAESPGFGYQVVGAAAGLERDHDERRFGRDGCKRADGHAVLLAFMADGDDGDAAGPVAHGRPEIILGYGL